MDVTALCIRLLISVLMLLGLNTCCAHKDGAAFLHIFPKRLQFFDYEVISLNCPFDGSADWRLMSTLQHFSANSSSNGSTSAGFKVIRAAFPSDSGEYWCEDEGGQRTNSINITVTTGSVILEGPVLPLKEGDDVTLQCKMKKNATRFPADFYKDGLKFKTDYKGITTINNVSTSDDGLYKCFIGGAGESPESRLVVEGSKNHNVSGPSSDVMGETHPGFNLFLWIAVSALLLVLLLLVIAVVNCRKHNSTEDKTGANYRGAESNNDPHDVTYAVVQKKPRERATSPDEMIDPYYTTSADVGIRTGEVIVGGDTLIDPYSYAYASVNIKEKVVGGDSLNDPYSYAYASVKRKEKVAGGGSLIDPCTVTYASVNKKGKGPKKSAVGQPEDDPVYSLAKYTQVATESRNT